MTTDEIETRWWQDQIFRDRADRFAKDYAARSGVTVELLREWGRFPEPCHCQAFMCVGWQMGHQWEDALFDERGR